MGGARRNGTDAGRRTRPPHPPALPRCPRRSRSSGRRRALHRRRAGQRRKLGTRTNGRLPQTLRAVSLLNQHALKKPRSGAVFCICSNQEIGVVSYDKTSKISDNPPHKNGTHLYSNPPKTSYGVSLLGVIEFASRTIDTKQYFHDGAPRRTLWCCFRRRTLSDALGVSLYNTAKRNNAYQS